MALTVVPNPLDMEWQDWVATVVGYNAECRNTVSPYDKWEEFAQRLSMIEPNTPRPDFFEDWRAWAQALRRSIVF